MVKIFQFHNLLFYFHELGHRSMRHSQSASQENYTHFKRVITIIIDLIDNI